MRMHYERVITAVAFMAQFFSENSDEIEDALSDHKNKRSKSDPVLSRR